MPNPTSALGNKLRQAIKDKGVTQSAVARAFGVKPPTVSAEWLKHGRIAKRHYPKLVSYFGKPYDWWFADEMADLAKVADEPNTAAVDALVAAMAPEFLEVWLAFGRFLSTEQARHLRPTSLETAILSAVRELDTKSQAALLSNIQQLIKFQRDVGTLATKEQQSLVAAAQQTARKVQHGRGSPGGRDRPGGSIEGRPKSKTR